MILVTTLSATALTTLVITYVILAAIGGWTLTGWLFDKFNAKNKTIKINKPLQGLVSVDNAGNIVYARDDISMHIFADKRINGIAIK